MREMIVEGVVRAPHAVRVQLGECVRAMIYCDYPDNWPALLQQIHLLLTSQASGSEGGKEKKAGKEGGARRQLWGGASCVGGAVLWRGSFRVLQLLGG